MAADDKKIIFSMVGVSKAFTPNKNVLKDIYLSFFYGAKIGIIGLNGSGKSTVSSIIAGMQPASSGEMLQGQTVETRYHAGSTESRYRHDRAGGRHNCKHLSS